MTLTRSNAEPAASAAPFLSSVMRIEPQWIDYNGHLNMAYYNVIMDRAIDELFAAMGMGPTHLEARNCSTMTAECHVRYLREVHLEDPVQVAMYLIAADEKRIHTFEEMRHATEGWISATSENITLHIDMSQRRVAPFPADIAAQVQAMAESHSGLARPDGVGRRIEMPARK